MFTDDPSPFRPPGTPSWMIPALVVAVFALFALCAYNDRFSARAERSLPQRSRATPPAGVAVLPQSIERNVVAQPGPTPSPVVSQAPPVPTPDRVTIYLCKAYAGGTFWSNAICSAQRATIDRMTSVPASLSFEAQVAIASGEAREAATLYAVPQPIGAGAIAERSDASRRPDICTIYDQQVRDLDAEARLPQSAQRQDQIRLDRMNVMSSRAAQRC